MLPLMAFRNEEDSPDWERIKSAPIKKVFLFIKESMAYELLCWFPSGLPSSSSAHFPGYNAVTRWSLLWLRRRSCFPYVH